MPGESPEGFRHEPVGPATYGPANLSLTWLKELNPAETAQSAHENTILSAILSANGRIVFVEVNGVRP